MPLPLAICGLAFLSPFPDTKPTHIVTGVYISGTRVGQNEYSVAQNGEFESRTAMAIGSISISSSVTGRFAQGKLVDAVTDSSTPGGVLKIALSNGNVTVTAKGKTVSHKLESEILALAGNLHPQFNAVAALVAEQQLEKNPASKTAEVKAYVVDGGSFLPLKITLLQPKVVLVNGQRRTAKHFSEEFAGIPVDLLVDDNGHVAAEDVPSQHLRFIEEGWEASFEDPIGKFPELSQATYKVKTEQGVKMRTRDGVELACDVVRPDDDQRHPAILVRTPYGKGTETAGGAFYATRGYVYVAQDCRGREDSGGEWDPFIHEGPDGYDTIQWIAKQPWCDGKVGMIGGSYSGAVQWSAAVLAPPALKCIVPEVSPPDAMHNLPFDNGIFMLYGGLWWSKIVAGRHTDFSTLTGALPHPEGFDTLPLGKVDSAVLGQHLEFFDKWLSRPTINDWKGWDYTYHLVDSHVPALHISGTWDGDEIGTHIQWSTLRRLGRKDQWIVFGPWVHAFNTNHSFGGVEYGPGAIVDLDSLFLRWFDTWLKGKKVGMDKVPHVRLFVTGANRWLDLPDWPAPTTPERTLYFAKGGLSRQPGAAEKFDYTYDPAKDAKGKHFLSDMATKESSTVVKLDEVKGVVLKTPPLAEDTAIAAPLRADIFFRTSAKDTDLFVEVLDIAPNGEARGVGQPGKIRGSYLQGVDAVRPLQPESVYHATIEPWDFAHEFKKGHRIGVIVVSSMFPAYARNLGTAEPVKTATRMVVQKNEILMGKGYPSSVSFHVLWEGKKN